MVNPIPFAESVLLTNAAATYYTLARGSSAIVKKLTLTNTDLTTAYTVTIYIVASGGAAGAVNELVNARAIGAGQTLDITEAVNQMLNPGDFISALASVGAKVALRISGVEIA